jgi:hypothetical protein
MTRLQNEPPSATREPLIDEMIDETFPASDPPQLTERRDGGAATTAPDAPARGRDQLAHGVQPTIGNQGSIPASGVLEETVPLSDLGAVHLRFDGGFQRLHIYLGDEGLALDAPALDRLIAVLSQKRARM